MDIKFNLLTENLDRYLNNILKYFEGNVPNNEILMKDYIYIYTECYNISILRSEEYNYSQLLYEYYCNKVTNYLNNINLIYNENIIKNLTVEWEKFNILINILSKFFSYLEKYYIKNNNLTYLFDFGINNFYNIIFKPIFNSNEINLINNVFDKINKLRYEPDEDISNFINMLKILDNKNKDYIYFCEKFLESSKYYFINKKNKLILENRIDFYLITCDNIINQEKQNKYKFDNKTIDRLIFDLHKIFLFDDYKMILDDNEYGFKKSLQKLSFDYLKKLFYLFSLNNDALKYMLDLFFEYNNEILNEIIYSCQLNNYQELFKNIINHYNHINYINNNYFNNSIKIQEIIAKNYSQLFIKEFNKLNLINCFNIYIDQTLTNNIIDENTMFEFIDNSINLFIKISNKDLFIDIYQNYLSNRLLNNKYTDIEYEKYFISKIKMECGMAFTSKLEKMIFDYSKIPETNEKFKQSLLDNNISTDMVLDVSVLTNGLWPEFKNDSIKLPDKVLKHKDIFKNYYLLNNPSHKLTWKNCLDTVEISADFDTKYTIICNVYQACIILLFDNIQKLTLDEIVKETNIDKDKLKKIIISLTSNKYKLFILENENLHLNLNFTNKLKRFKLPQPTIIVKNKKEKIELDRSAIIDSTIVRILKSRKIIKHNELISDVLSQTKTFVPEISFIKNRIENLIEREYIERDDITTYKYIA